MSKEKLCQDTEAFLTDLARLVDKPGNIDLALKYTRLLFKMLRDRLSPDDSLYLISQLPLVLQKVYLDGWSPSTPTLSSEDELLQELKSLEVAQGKVVDYDESLSKIRLTFLVLRQYLLYGDLLTLLDSVSINFSKDIVRPKSPQPNFSF